MTPMAMTKAADMHRHMLHFTGRVQGVGFRYTVKNIALQYNVAGYVRNLPDGRVEVVMEGPESDTIEVVNEIRRKMNGYITRVDTNDAPATGEYQHFSIRH